MDQDFAVVVDADGAFPPHVGAQAVVQDAAPSVATDAPKVLTAHGLVAA